MYEEDWPNYEKYKDKAESMMGKWIREKGTDHEVCYVYDVTFNTTMNDWELSLYKINDLFNLIESDSVYLDDLPTYFANIKDSTGLKTYNKVKKNLDDLFNGIERKCSL